MSEKPSLSLVSEKRGETMDWDNLIPVIVGGIIGLAGGLAGPPLTHWLSEKSNRKKRRAEKLEELIGVLYEHEDWLELNRNIYMFGERSPKPLNPMARATAIVAIDFPQFGDVLKEYAKTEFDGAKADKEPWYELWKKLSGKGTGSS